MKTLDPLKAAIGAVSTNPSRPATAVIQDTDDARLVVFRIAPGQAVPPHTSPSTVMLSVLDGEGVLSGECDGKLVDRRCGSGDVVTFAPNEQHGMRADTTELFLLATITPRPGSR
jgi:quercetin dioxygenase-like cupin family protein